MATEGFYRHARLPPAGPHLSSTSQPRQNLPDGDARKPGHTTHPSGCWFRQLGLRLIRRYQLHGIGHGIGCGNQHDVGGMHIPAGDAVGLVAEQRCDGRCVAPRSAPSDAKLWRSTWGVMSAGRSPSSAVSKCSCKWSSVQSIEWYQAPQKQLLVGASANGSRCVRLSIDDFPLPGPVYKYDAKNRGGLLCPAPYRPIGSMTSLA